MAEETTYQRQRREAELDKRRGARFEQYEPRDAYPPETAKARKRERNRRHMEARRRALLVLSRAHAEEFERLVAEERRGVDRERGPLPGDEA